ncbi:MAG TPA: response regulator transcription factor [Hanamia sp.]|nr:response regulator transcription factor [Hanamia sp.]
MKILIIEDEKSLSESMSAYLSALDYHCDIAEDYNSAVYKTEYNDYDCILLDITLPGGNGLKVLEQLKKDKKTDGVLIISAKNSLDDKIKGLNLGADDYLSKPFHLSELNARIAAIIRRKRFDGNSVLQFGNITIDTQSKAVTVENNQVELTKKEYELLIYFLSNKKRIISKEAIAEHLWGNDMAGNFDFIYTHIKNLRKKLMDAGEADYIKSVYGMGYKFTMQ